MLYIASSQCYYDVEVMKVAKQQSELEAANVKRISLRLPSDLHEKVQSASEAHDRSLNNEITAALKEWVKRGK